MRKPSSKPMTEPSKEPLSREEFLQELIQGRGFAKELRESIPVGFDGGLGLREQGLLEKLVRSFDRLLSVMSPEVVEEVSLADVGRPRKRGKTNNSNESEGSVRSSLALPRDRRGCYKRRCNGETWEKLSPTMSADDYQWRKYGQKSINNAAHPRNYLRCTHKANKGCMATKQVQKISEDPVTFRTIYQGRHTCTDNSRLELPEIVFNLRDGDALGNDNLPFLLSFKIGDQVRNEEIHPDANSVVSAPRDEDYPGESLDLVSDHGEDASVGRHGSYMDMVADSDELQRFMMDFH
ncbi:hypothetical protein MLD38_023942 [Melastoma candidum]|uniref:Uncharacterized protein n=1 Tax=Melastoma candidum TaxID=119954 RepID=A0ACB9NQK3_9MYRT|nr:hypothetical protein MLD38_023942 [Melastoma candidum]